MTTLRRLVRKFNSWMNYHPPSALTTKGWRLFNEEFKENAPVRYWIKHDFNYNVKWPFRRQWNKIQAWINYRTFYRYHILKTGCGPGYQSIDNQMIHVNFNLLKDFVEIEQSQSSRMWNRRPAPYVWKRKYIPFYNKIWPIRDPEAAIEHFKWAATLDDPSLPPHERSDEQAHSAREVIALYKWWVEERPNRVLKEVPEYDNQGLGIMACLDQDFDSSAPDYVAHTEAMDYNSKAEERWNNEDEEMLVRLIRIRRSLWT